MNNATTDRGQGTRQGIDWLMLIAFMALAGVIVRALWFTPPEATQGNAQKILYVHASAAWVAFMAFIFVAIAGALYLWIRDERLDRFAVSSVEVGLVFTTVVLITGPLWGKPIWGGYWNWGDARLTSTLLLWLVFLGYMVMRGALEDRSLRARYSAILGILGALLVPFVHISVYLFDSAHPSPIVASPEVFTERRGIPMVMLTTLLLAVGACTLLYAALVRARYRLEIEREALESAAMGGHSDA